MNAQVSSVFESASLGDSARAGLYVHVPFCDSKCGYCDFYSVAIKDRDSSPLVDALIRELRGRVPKSGYEVQTIFFGGGTPTVIPIEQLESLLNATREVVDMSRVIEFTVEANPATVDDAKAELLVRNGVTRVSMGAQSFIPSELASLERLHSPEDIPPSVAILRRHGIGQLNLDLIFGVPGQTLDTWRESLRRAIELEPNHIACYGLTYEPGTRLTAQRETGRLRSCDEELETEMFESTVDILGNAGLQQYEISNFARPGCECRHNLLYWRNEPYIGIGPSAAGCLQNRRYKNISDIGGYVRLIGTKGSAELESERIDGETLIHELVLMQLRLNEGLSVRDFRARTGHDPRELFAESLHPLNGSGLMEWDDKSIRLTRRGRLLANHVMAELIASVNSVEALSPRALALPGDIALPVIAA